MPKIPSMAAPYQHHNHHHHQPHPLPHLKDDVRAGGLFAPEQRSSAPSAPRSSGGEHTSDLELKSNKDFYRTNDVRPPFTYAALIRQVCKVCIYFILYNMQCSSP